MTQSFHSQVCSYKDSATNAQEDTNKNAHTGAVCNSGKLGEVTLMSKDRRIDQLWHIHKTAYISSGD